MMQAGRTRRGRPSRQTSDVSAADEARLRLVITVDECVSFHVAVRCPCAQLPTRVAPASAAVPAKSPVVRSTAKLSNLSDAPPATATGDCVLMGRDSSGTRVGWDGGLGGEGGGGDGSAGGFGGGARLASVFVAAFVGAFEGALVVLTV